jgi:integrase
MATKTTTKKTQTQEITRPRFEGLWRQKKANGKGYRYLLKGKDSEGRMVFVTVPIDDLRDTDAEFIHKCEQARAELEKKLHPELERKTLSYYLDRYIELRHLRPGSQYQYKHHLAGYDLDDANNKAQLEALLKSDKSSSSIKQITGIINTFFKYCIGEGVLSTAGTVIKNPASGVREGRFNHRTRTPTDEETAQLLEWAKGNIEDELFVRLLIATGARCSTLEIVKVSDLDSENRIHLINVKCQKSYDFPILITDQRLIELWGEVSKLRGKNDYLFTDGVKTGRRTKFYMYKHFAPDAQGERISPHSYRHAFACRAVQNGVPIEIVSKLLDHSSTATTMTYYAKHSQGQLDAAIAKVAGKTETTFPHM